MATDAGSDRTEADNPDSVSTPERPPALDAADVVLVGSPGLGPRDGLPEAVGYSYGAAIGEAHVERLRVPAPEVAQGIVGYAALALGPGLSASTSGRRMEVTSFERGLTGEEPSIQQGYSYSQSEPGEGPTAATRDADGVESPRPAGGRKAGPPDGKGRKV